MSANTARFRYHGTGGALLGLVAVNALLTVLTLGIYSFWAKNRVRQFHYGHTEAGGDRFTYHGTGGELFRGWIRAFAVLLLLVVAFAVLTLVSGGKTAPVTTQVAMMLVLYGTAGVLVLAAINLTRRYRMSRTSWRGIHFSFHGSTRAFITMMVQGTLLSIVTLGLHTPFFQSQRRAFLVQHTRFGAEEFSYHGNGRALFAEFLKALVLTIPTLGLCWIWYAAFKHRYLWSQTRMRGGQFISSVTAGDLFRVTAVNLMLVLFTAGIATPWAITRMHAFWCAHLRLVGTVDWASLDQRAQVADAFGEGLAESLDVEVGL